MTIRVSIVPKTITESDRGGVVQFKMQLSDENGSAISGGNYFFEIRNPSLRPTRRNLMMRSGGEEEEQAVCFDVPDDIARGSHPFTIVGGNGRANGIIPSQLPSAASLTMNVNSDIPITVDGFNTAFTGGTVNRGDIITLVMSLDNPSDSTEEFQYRLTSDQQQVFEVIGGVFTITGTEEVRTFLRVRDDAEFVSGTITIDPMNDAARALASQFTASGRSTHGFTVVQVEQPSVDSFNIAFTPHDIERGGLLLATVSMVNPSSHNFDFQILSNVDVFEASGDNYRFTIHGDEVVRIFLRVRDDAILEPGVVRIEPVSDELTDPARAVNSVLEASGNTATFLIVDATENEVIPVPSNITLDLDLSRRYFEEPLFLERFRLPSPDLWTASDVGPTNLVLTNLRIRLDHDELYQVPFVPETGSSAEYLQGIDNYPGRCWIRLSINNGRRETISIGDTPRYRLTGIATFSIFVRQNLNKRETNIISEEISNYILGWKQARRQEAKYANISVLRAETTFAVEAVANGWAQSNLVFTFTQDFTI